MEQYFSIADNLGGAEQLIFKLATFHKRRGKEVCICFLREETNSVWREAGFDVFYCDNKISAFYSYCKSKVFSNIFSSHLMLNSLLGLFRTIGVLKVDRLICRESTTVFSRYKGVKLLQYKLAYYFGYRNIELLITQTDAMKTNLLDELPYLNERMKICTIPNPFEFPSNPVLPKVTTYPYVVSAGRLIPEKGFIYLIEAFSMMKNEYHDLKLIILGEGELREKLQNRILALELREDIVLKGFVEDVYPYFKGAQLCVVSSQVEGFPNVLLQMMSQNERIVSTLCAGGIERLKGVEVCPPNNVKQLYMAMKLAMTNDRFCENRCLFDEELKKRSVDQFLFAINACTKKY